MSEMGSMPPTIVFVGHVDHGKSSLLGRLVLTSDMRRSSNIVRQFDDQAFEAAYLLDQLEEERERSMTIDTTEMFVRIGGQSFRFVDCPGHLELVKNMVSGASRADGAVLVVDATRGMEGQARKHLEVLALLGIKRVIVAVNKFDLVDEEMRRERFMTLRERISTEMQSLELESVAIVPVSARCGLGIESANVEGLDGEASSLVDCLLGEAWRLPRGDEPLILPVQAVQDGMVLGQVVSGTLAVGDDVILPRSQRRFKVARILQFPSEVGQVAAPASVALDLSELHSAESAAALLPSDILIAADEPFDLQQSVRAKLVWLGDKEVKRAELTSYNRRIAATLTAGGRDQFNYADIVDVELKLAEPLLRLRARREFALNRVVLHAEGKVIAGGLTE